VSLLSGLGHASLLSLEVAVVDDLKAAHVLLLKSPQALLLLALLLEKRLLNELLITLMKNGSLLLGIKALKVVGLDTVRGKHGSHGGGVLSHQVVSEGVFNFMLLLVVPVLALLDLIITLLLGKLEVLLLSGLEHSGARCLMLLLSLLENLVKVYCLLIIGTIKRVINMTLQLTSSQTVNIP